MKAKLRDMALPCKLASTHGDYRPWKLNLKTWHCFNNCSSDFTDKCRQSQTGFSVCYPCKLDFETWHISCKLASTHGDYRPWKCNFETWRLPCKLASTYGSYRPWKLNFQTWRLPCELASTHGDYHPWKLGLEPGDYHVSLLWPTETTIHES